MGNRPYIPQSGNFNRQVAGNSHTVAKTKEMVKVNLSLCLIKHHSVKAYGVVRDTAPSTFNLSI
jgi:hypothetical protein